MISLDGVMLRILVKLWQNVSFPTIRSIRLGLMTKVFVNFRC